MNVTEDDKPNYIGESGYGRNRAWFEAFFTSQFSNTTIVRLPGLFARDLKKNFIYDLIHNRSDQVSSVHQDSIFQFYNVEGIWDLINKCHEEDILLLNVATEPVSAQEIADVFNVNLTRSKDKIEYRMKSNHFKSFDGKNGYLQSKEHVLEGISRLRKLS
jgi:dTDP-4-dehydrorhamnose reductase